MKINFGWIREFVPLTQDASSVAHDLTMAGLEVEAIEEFRGETVFEVGVTPNRMDCLSHLGVARDLAALYRLPLTLPPVEPAEGRSAAEAVASVAVEDPEGCPRYSARVVDGVKVGPTPEKAALRLESVGVRSINNLVDATNYVMMELGQPLHAFDHKLLAEGRIVVRRAGEGERFRTLDDQPRSLAAGDLLICDGAGPVALAGIMGGANSEVRSDTRTLLLESACFDPMTVRRTSKRLGLSTEASYRFERGTDPEGTVRAVDRLARLIIEWGGGKAARGVLDVYPRPFPRRALALSLARLSALLGLEVPEAEVAGILSRLGFAVTPRKGEVAVVVPSWRRDVSREEDLVEEIARIHGFDHIPATMPVGASVPVKRSHAERVEQAARTALEGAGFSEAIDFSFIGRADLARLRLRVSGEAAADVCLLNPLSEEMEVMRSSLLPGLFATAARNASRRVRRARFYELGNAFFPGGGEGAVTVREERRLSGVIYGERATKPWYRDREESSFFDVKGAVESVLAALGVGGASWREETAPYLAPGQSAAVHVGGRPAGRLGTVHPEVAAAWELKGWVGCFELDLALLEEKADFSRRFRPLARFPELLRDLSLLVPRAHPWSDLQAEAVRAGGSRLASVRLFDLYEGKGVPAGFRSLAFALVFADPERTLTDEEVEGEMGAIVKQLEEKFGAKLR